MTDPKTILAFLNDHFDDIKTLYKIDQKQKTISFRELGLIFKTELMINRLREYEVLNEKIDGNFTLNEVYKHFIAFLLDDFMLDMPEQIKKYHTSFSDLEQKLKTSSDKNNIIDAIDGLLEETSRFESTIQRNVNGLIKQSKLIKINKQKLDYTKKAKATRKLIGTYVTPLNVILDNHSESISSIIDNIIQEANDQRFNHADVNLRDKYKMLYFFCSSVINKLLSQTRLLIQEVLPLLRNIERESAVLSGCLTFLNNNKVYPVPNLLNKERNATYSSNAKYEAQNIWEGYQGTDEEVIIQKSELISDIWFYDKDKYTSILLKSLPIDNFYQFIAKELEKELITDLQNIESKKFFDLSKLIFEKDIAVNYKSHRFDIELLDTVISVPTVEIRSIH